MKQELIYEGKAKQLYASSNQGEVIIHYKDDATAFNGIKKASIENKGILNNAISTRIYRYLGEHGIRTHYLETLNESDQRCLAVTIIPLEVIVRNVAAGSFSKRLQVEEGTPLQHVVFELCYKNDDLGDPLINDDHALALGIATEADLAQIRAMTFSINQLLIQLFLQCSIELIDFKIEFGKTASGELVLADEISPDSCRLWDMESHEKLDKDRFRRDLGKVQEAYQEILDRLIGVLDK